MLSVILELAEQISHYLHPEISRFVGEKLYLYDGYARRVERVSRRRCDDAFIIHYLDNEGNTLSFVIKLTE